jgi:hypothetical protein
MRQFSITGLYKRVAPLLFLALLSTRAFPQTESRVSANDRTASAQAQSNPRAALGSIIPRSVQTTTLRGSGAGGTNQHQIQSHGEVAPLISHGDPIPVPPSAGGQTFATGLHPLRETRILSIKVEHFQKGDVPYVEYTQEVFQRI